MMTLELIKSINKAPTRVHRRMHAWEGPWTAVTALMLACVWRCAHPEAADSGNFDGSIVIAAQALNTTK